MGKKQKNFYYPAKQSEVLTQQALWDKKKPRTYFKGKEYTIMLHWKKPHELLSEGEFIAFAFTDRNNVESLQVGKIIGFETDYSSFHVYFAIGSTTIGENVTANRIIAIRDKGTQEIKDLPGTYQILQPEHYLLYNPKT